MIDESITLCAHCLRCGRRSIVARGATLSALPDEASAAPRLRCDMCGGRRIRLHPAHGPVELLAFMTGRT